MVRKREYIYLKVNIFAGISKWSYPCHALYIFAGFADVPDYKIRLQKNYLKIINTIKHNDEENI